ncbi:response regulator transcription factor [Clostridium algidicarnis]|uniref:response regulator transcription factor n=1 Tax=Clostridium algidicarnis TaxID=37659 RepID=UPI001C0B2862|nr:response regulator transcription factor [Clostridium algidicarnis]MBU3203947.1 response regulator transcription factor [Clostridium algidicarnis]MBU3212101.1 response regulator transcription factor [Clostridium algidicarnis]MBU3221394.1 response regulator transcription factor [Clostridium algidicarnis]
MEKIKLLIVDDEKLIREGLKVMLSVFEDIEVVGIAENGYKALEICKTTNVDVVLMDIRMKDCDGVMGTRLIKEQFTKIKVIILTTFKDKEYIQEALRYGAFGYMLKDSSHDVIYEGIKTAYKGNMVVHPDVAIEMMGSNGVIKSNIDKYRLLDKEFKIIEAIAKGLSNKEISEELFLSEGTIKNNITNILSKLKLRDRTQIAIFAFKNGIVT